MKKYIFLLGFLCSFSLSNAQKIVELSNPVTNGKANFSCNGFLLKPGFSFKAATNNSLSFGIDKLTCTNWVSNITAYDTDGYPNGYNIDKQRLVGEIPFENTVTPTGAVSYNVPVEIYPGRNSLQPNILLAYNSMGGNSVAGMGWNIGGLSAITPVNSNIYYDGKTAPITLDGNAVYALDGMRLVKQVGSTNLESEQGNIIVVPKTNYFEVRYPNGNKAIYGYTTSTSAQLSYPITRMEDCLGNYIDYQYIKDNNMYYISEINYGASTTDKHYASVKFVYTGREDITPFYSAGLEVKQTKLLTRINSYFNSTLLKSYLLRHELKDVSLLRQIDCLSNGQTINPLVFHYGNNKKGEIKRSEYKMSAYYKKGQTNFRPIKLNITSPKDDFIALPPDKSNYDLVQTQTKTDWLGKPQSVHYKFGSSFNAEDDLLIYLDGGSRFKTIKAGAYFQGLFAGDIDGDNNDELLKINNNSDKSSSIISLTKYKYDISIPENGGWFKKDTFSITTESKDVKDGDLQSPEWRNYLLGDFSGDGKSSLLIVAYGENFKKEKRSTYLTFIDLNQKKIIGQGTSSIEILPQDRILLIDYDGDGKADLCHIKCHSTTDHFSFIGVSVYNIDPLNASLKSIAGFSIETYQEPNLKLREFLFGDINGDGKTDIIVSPRASFIKKRYVHDGACAGCCSMMATSPEELEMTGEFPVEMQCGPTKKCIIKGVEDYYEAGGSNLWSIYYSDGKKSFIGKNFTNGLHYMENSYSLCDINNDGLPDLAVKDNKGTLSIYTNNKGVFETTEYYKASNPSVWGDLISASVFNLSKQNQLLTTGGNIFYQETNELNQRLLTTSISSLGIITKHYYSDLYDLVTYAPKIVQTYPYAGIGGRLALSNEVKIFAQGQLAGSNRYKYTNGVIHKQGLGFKGFEQITITDNIRNITSTQKFAPENFSQLVQEDSPISTVTYDYTTNVANNKAVRIRLNKQITKDKLTDVTVTKSYSNYDTYGNPQNETIDYGSNIKTERSITYQNINNNDDYLLGLPLVETIKSTYGTHVITTKTAITYKNKNLPENKKEYYNDKLVSTETYLYNTKWELTESQIKAYESTKVLTNKFAYDTYGRLIKETDPLGMTTEKVFGGNGLLSYTKNYKGKTTKFEYDAFGRVIKTTYPDNTIETSKITWTSSPSTALYVATTTASGQPATQVYYDALGREIRKGQMRFDGKYLYTDNEYNRYGQLYRTSLPFKGGAPAKWNTYTYDNYDRITALKYASDKEDTYSYNKNTITSIIDGISTTKTHDALGQAISVKDSAGIITYNYRADGQYTSIVAPKAAGVTDAAVTTSFEYDDYGRQIKLVDPSAGTRSYAYDADGNISKETDADSRVTSMTYDSYNRLKTKTSAGLTTTYTYDAVNGLLMSASNTNRTLTYVYDKDLDRLQSEKETIVDSKWLQKSYSYSGGNITATTYTSQSGNIVTENYIYTNGHNTEIKLNNNTTSIWKLTGENNMGLASNANTGILARTYGYDDYGLPTSRIVKNGSVAIQNFGYEFNPLTGNLNWRKDNNRNIQETFGYDGLNRLTSVNGRASYTLTYDVMGNIKSHSAVGSFDYQHPNKPYAITGATSNIIPAKNQKIDYNAMLRPISITENGYNANLSYGEDGERIKMELTKDKALQLKRYYLGGQYEVDEDIAGNKERLYLGGDAYSAAAVYVKQNGKWEVQYICRDYLGSITHVTNNAGTVLQELSYDAWGRLRNPADQVAYAVYAEPTPLLGRGYTGHEHLTMFGLINMNARLYDPVVGRFLSPDPYVQAPWMSQNFNRYNYVLNNPLRWTDQTGEWFGIDDLVAAAIGGIVNLGVNIWQGNIYGTPWEIIGKGAAAFGAGAVAGNLALYGPAGWAAGGAIVGATNTALSGGNVGNIIQGAGIGSIAGLAGGYAGQFAANSLGSVAINGFKIGSPVLKGAISGMAGGTGGGYVGGFTSGLLMTGDIRQANQLGLEGMKFGAALGTFTGAAGGYKYAKDHDLNMWNGKWNGKISINSESHRTMPQNLTEQLTLSEAQSGRGVQIMNEAIGDPNWTGWQKMQYTHRSEGYIMKTINGKMMYLPAESTTTIHYWKNIKTGETSGFKFK